MARVLTKKSTVPGKVPLAADLEIGELAVNTADAKLYTKHSDNTIKQLGGDAASGYFRTEPITATSSGQTSFTVPGGYTPGAIFVSLNGASLPPADFTATDGTNVVLESGDGIVAGSVLLVHVLSAFEVANALPLGGTAADSSKLGGQPPEHYLGGGSWGEITGALADQADLASALAAKAAASDIDFTIIYPNGGSAESPANVVINSRYVMGNPFPGHYVICTAEVSYNGKWGATGWFTTFYNGVHEGHGVQAHQLLPDDSIIVQTGRNNVLWSGAASGGSHGDVASGSLPCRVLVRKLKGAIA